MSSQGASAEKTNTYTGCFLFPIFSLLLRKKEGKKRKEGRGWAGRVEEGKEGDLILL